MAKFDTSNKKVPEEKQAKEIQKFVSNYRKKYIPDKYNQIYMIDELMNSDIDHYISISNRSDGKSFNYIGFFCQFAYVYGVGFTLIGRHYTVRQAYARFIEKIFDTLNCFDSKDLTMRRTDFYIMVLYKGKCLGVITDLNEATDLKYHSNFLKDYPLIIYDEFLALDDDYESDEWGKLKTIYSSINRDEKIPFIQFPKVIYLGNAVNFSSPILAYLKVYNILENHPINSMKAYGNIVLEMRRNENINQERNLRAFDEDQDNLTLGQFEINNHLIAKDTDYKELSQDPLLFNIKDGAQYIKVRANPYTRLVILSIEKEAEFSVDYVTKLKDKREDNVYLEENFYKDLTKKFDKGLFLFENNFSKDFILQNLYDLDFRKVIKHYQMKDNESFEEKEKIFQDNYMEDTKKALVNRFFGG